MPNDKIGAEPRPDAGGHDAETHRNTAEGTRVAAESARSEAELRRELAETARLAAEEARTAAERLRDEAVAAVRATSDTLVTALEHMKKVEEMRRHRDRLDAKNRDSH